HQMVDAEAPREQRGKQRGKGTELAGNAERYSCDGDRKRKGDGDEHTAPTEMVIEPGKADRCQPFMRHPGRVRHAPGENAAIGNLEVLDNPATGGNVKIEFLNGQVLRVD